MSQSRPVQDEPAAERSAPAADRVDARARKRALLAELEQSWQAGAPLRPEDLLARWPTDPQADPDVASLLFEDWRQRRQRGQEGSRQELEQRFPEHRESLASLFHRQDIIHSLGCSRPSGFSLALPGVGDELFGFRLRHELGRGAFARVFLGEQDQLAGRPVVLKISQAESAEPQTLAQLQHTNIVPIYSLHEDAKSGLRLVCMPYFGGASLAQVLRAVRNETKQPQHGVQFAKALHAVQSGPLPALGVPQETAAASPPPAWERLTYLQAAAWIVARLADALEHAHERGILHRDVKPSNILLGADGEPMLLDFNLAQKIEDQAKATLGGTVAYMAPEHLRAMASRDPVVSRGVDHRADIYSLGMVLYEMLVGERPFEQSASYAPMPALIEAMAVERSRATPSARRYRLDLPWSLESIVRKCLAPDPAARYQHAEQLAQDLRAFLGDQPLPHAPELSRVERLRKWLRRHPRLASSGSVGGVAAALLLTAAVALSGMHHHLQATQDELSDADARERHQAYDASTLRALCLVNTAADWASRDHVEQGILECEAALSVYEVLTRDDWQERDDWRRLLSADRAENTRELLLLLARGRTQRAPRDPTVLHGALDLLAKAESIQGLRPTPALWEDRADYWERLGAVEAAQAARAQARQHPPSSARDYYLLATALIRREGKTSAKALAALDEAVRRNPKHYWTYTQRGAVHFERGDWLLAARDFGVCQGLWPDYPLAYFNLGCVHLQKGEPAEAIGEFTRALNLDSQFRIAQINRGLMCLQLRRYSQALDDFSRLIDQGHADAVVWTGRGQALEGLHRHAEADAAFARADSLAPHGDVIARANLRSAYGFAVSARLPKKAHAAFLEILTSLPEHPKALYGLGMFAANQDQLDQALEYFQRAVAADPGFNDARRFRGVLLARRGQMTEAVADINTCLEREPQSGATHYAAACVAARASERGDPAAAQASVEQAATFLQRAFDLGYGREQAGADPDLAGLRRHAEFQRLLSSKPQP